MQLMAAPAFISDLGVIRFLFLFPCICCLCVDYFCCSLKGKIMNTGLFLKVASAFYDLSMEFNKGSKVVCKMRKRLAHWE